MPGSTGTKRIKVADVPFARLTKGDVDALVEIEAFRALDERYRTSAPFRTILENHTRLVDFHEGEIIVRKGDWGSTAYFIVTGRVVVTHGDGVSDEVLGRRTSQRKGLFAALLQHWLNHRNPEYRDVKQYQQLQGTGLRGEGDTARIYLQDVPAVLERSSASVTLEPGELFGEIAALGRTARTATVIARSDCQLLEVRWQGLRSLLRKDSGFRTLVEKTFRQNALRSFLLASPTFQHLKDNEAAMEELLSGAQLETYGEYDAVGTFKELATESAAKNLTEEPVIAAEGDYPNGLIMVRSGLARVSRRHHHGHLTVSYLSPGQIYGYSDIAEGYSSREQLSLKYSLRAIGFVSVVRIPTPLVEKHLLERAPTVGAASKGAAAKDPLSRVAKVESRQINQGLVEFLTQKRFVNGTKTMLIDLDRCTRCDDCVRACASTHDNNPRFVRQGPTYGNVMIANACMHCQDPVCMIECPTGAISRLEDEGHVTINDLTCIGCSMCAKNCPYDAIRMVEIRDRSGAFIRDTATHTPIVKATKCDLCADQWGGPACQRACPHDALVRIDMRDIQHLVAWDNQ